VKQFAIEGRAGYPAAARTRESGVENPVIAEVKRGPITESRHRGAWALCDAAGKLVTSGGDVHVPVYPRSATKIFQAIPMVESGAADAFGFIEEELSLACASHNGEAEHVRVARSMLAKAGMREEQLECGAHWPIRAEAAHALARAGGTPLAVHNNCSGKHAGMLALARKLGVDPQGYVEAAHPVQQQVANTLARYCEVEPARLPVAIDGCSVPTWAMPLSAMAAGFARLTQPGEAAAARLIAAVRSAPFMVAGTGRFDTRLMQAVPRLFIKVGAEGVYCGAIPHAGLGFALKCDDGATRAAEVAIAGLLAGAGVWSTEEAQALEGFAREESRNWRNIPVGDVHAIRF
jgi:L-asparaginase II